MVTQKLFLLKGYPSTPDISQSSTSEDESDFRIPKDCSEKSSAVELFCYDKFEETPNEKLVNMSKLTKSYFRFIEIDFSI